MVLVDLENVLRGSIWWADYAHTWQWGQKNYRHSDKPTTWSCQVQLDC